MSKVLRIIFKGLGTMLASAIFATGLLAQSGEGSIRGQVFDQSGGAIPALTVTAIGPDKVAHTAQTNEEGKYFFRNLEPGAYRVEIHLQGFADFIQPNIEVTRGKPQVVDAHLVVATEKQQVNVESEATQVSVSSENNASALVIKGKDLEALSDDPDELEQDLQALAGPSAGPNGGQIYIDGFTGGQLPPKAAIREIRVNQNPFSAQYDKLGYGRVEIFTKPGMDQFHGQIFTNFNDSAFNSRSPFATEVPAYHSEFFEGNIGGPLNKRASFFFDGEHRNIQDASIVSAITLDPNFNEIPFSDSILTPRTRTELSPRLDYQVSKNNTLTVRYQYWKNDVTNSGVGQFSLPSLAFNDGSTEQSLQVSDTQILGEGTVNETRFRFERGTDSQTPQSLLPTISVLGAFTAGGNSRGLSSDLADNYELQNYTSMNRGKHFIRFGARLRDTAESNTADSGFNGTFTFPSINAYRITAMGIQQGLTGAQIRAQGGGASQFSIVSGYPLIDVNQYDLGLYAEDDWKLRPNITLSVGMRFETQNNINDHTDFAPRIGLAWGLGGGGHPKTVLRAGTGIFYDRFGEGQVLNALRLNGLTQQQFVVNEPDFYPAIPPVDTLASSQTFPTIYRIGSTLQAPYIVQTAIGLERQVSRTATVSLTYLNAHGVHQLLTRNVNSPLPGTYNPADPSSGTRPFGSVGNIYEYESDGLFNQNQMIANFNIRAGAKLSLFGFYTLNFANSNTAGANSFPTDQYDIAQDYGRASFDVRHRFFMGGTMALAHGFRLSPFLVATSGPPFNITLGRDLNGDSIFNDRPSFATVLTDPNMVITQWGTFNKVPLPGETIIPVNYGQSPGQFSLNMRLAKTFGFGEKKGGGGAGGFGGMHGGPRGGGLGGRGLSGGGGGGFFGGPPSNARFNLELSVNARNVFNKVNLGSPVGNLNSPLFGQSNSIVGGFGGMSGANRMLYLQARFSF